MKFLNLLWSSFLIASFCFLDRAQCILHGQKVDKQGLYDYKHLVGILAIKTSGDYPVVPCTGGILDDFHILTAAHCFAPRNETDFLDFKDITVYAHTLINRDSPTQAVIKRKVVKVFVPSSYFDDRYADIAIVELVTSLKVKQNSNKLQKLELPESNFRVSPGDFANVAGYGAYAIKSEKIIDGKKKYEYHSDGLLRTMDVEVVFDSLFDGKFISARPIDSTPGKPKGICSGDSGSPLVIKNGENIEVIGTVKGNRPGCDDTRVNDPGYYVPVSQYVKSFINKVLKNNTDSTIVEKDYSGIFTCIYRLVGKLG